MIETSVEIEGLDDLTKQLTRLVSLAKQQQYVMNAASYALSPIVKEVKRLAPKAESEYIRYRNGRKDKVKPGGLKKAISRKRVKLEKSRGVALQIKYNKAFYWRFLEYGTPNMAAIPFIRPGFDTKKSEALQRFKDRYRSYVDDVIQRRASAGGNGDAGD
ncbi:HK97-gp10 family putative phage morphogenesis protein [Acinetobacter sp. TR11]|uniref:HK97-gp10 family putative phage morphogenesis protein n=1 Tax=Acinetobacter sp. TR11 TaxID=3003393 RepID=UPI0022AC4E62|nr:HK97-gp10 family putative phage morphogenesis protein [Acinetobacter sp. TR11]WAU73090.1 HK97 gp10 family phage protein [Acinetobacter sp. TR11]